MPSATTSVRIRRFDRPNTRSKEQLENDSLRKQRDVWRDERMLEMNDFAVDELARCNTSADISPATYAAAYSAGYDLADNYPHDFRTETGIEIRRAALSSLEYNTRTRSERVRARTREIQTLRYAITNWDAVNADAYIDVSVDAIRKALQGLKENIPARSITLSFNQRAGAYLLNWVYSGLQMTPHYNHTAWLNFYHRVTVPLPRMKFSLALQRNAVATASPVRGEQSYGLYISSAVHPHQMRHRIFCLGDYAAAIDEARMAHDWPTLIMLYKQFLETCNPEDTAGQRWPTMPWTTINQIVRPRLRDHVDNQYNRLRYVQHYAPGSYYTLPCFVGNIQPPTNVDHYSEQRSCEIPYFAFMRDGKFLLVQSSHTGHPAPVPFERNFKTFRDLYPDMMTDLLPSQEEYDFICNVIARGAPSMRDNPPLDWSQLGARSSEPEPAPVATVEPAPERPAVREIGYVSSLDEAYAA